MKKTEKRDTEGSTFNTTNPRHQWRDNRQPEDDTRETTEHRRRSINEDQINNQISTREIKKNRSTVSNKIISHRGYDK